MPWSLALDLGFARGRAVSLRDPVDQGQGLAGRGHAFAGGARRGCSLGHLGAGPVLLGIQKAGRGERDPPHGMELELKQQPRCIACLYLGLGASVVFLLRQVLSALGLGTGYVVSNGHWRQKKKSVS